MLGLEMLLQVAGILTGRHRGVGWEEVDNVYAGKSCSKNMSLGVRGGICKKSQLF